MLAPIHERVGRCLVVVRRRAAVARADEELRVVDDHVFHRRVAHAPLDDVEEGVSTVADTFVCVELRRFVEHTWDTAHASKNLSNRDFTDDGIGVFLSEGNGFLLSFCDFVLHLLFESVRGELSAGGLLGGCDSSFEKRVHHVVRY